MTGGASKKAPAKKAAPPKAESQEDLLHPSVFEEASDEAEKEAESAEKASQQAAAHKKTIKIAKKAIKKAHKAKQAPVPPKAKKAKNTDMLAVSDSADSDEAVDAEDKLLDEPEESEALTETEHKDAAPAGLGGLAAKYLAEDKVSIE